MIIKALVATAFAFALSLPAAAASLTRISTNGSLGNISFQHLAMNAAGDFVGVSNSRVFTGSVAEQRVTQVMALENASFVLSTTTNLQVGEQWIDIGLDVVSSRLAINAQGDFILASNNRLYTGNARTGAPRQVADGGAFTEFQSVKINDAGQYVAIGTEKIFGGRVADTAATMLLAEAFGAFDVARVYAFQNRVDGTAGDQRLALNASGQFVAATGSAVYVGNLTDMTVASVFEQRLIGLRHVQLNDQGQIAVVSEQDVFVGSAN